MQDNRNLIVALVLSVIVLIGWEVFIVGPQQKKQQELAAQQTTSQTVAGGTTAGGTTTPTSSAPATPASQPTLTRDAALAQSQRVAIDTAALSGSINLTGGRLDDLRLRDYHETVDDKSPTIVLLSPSGAPDAYFAEFGWTAAADAGKVPGPDTVWTAPAGAKLTAQSPVTLTYDNGTGLTFQRTIAVDDKYMFTVTDTVKNSGSATVSLTPYGRVTHFGNPANGSYILHLGLIAAVGDQHLRQESYKSLDGDKTVAFDKASSGFFGINDKYWATALVPEPGKDFLAKMEKIDSPNGYQADFTGTPVSLAPGASADTASRLFAGAKQVAVINGYRDAVPGGIPRFDLLIDWGEWVWIGTKPMFAVIDFFFHLFGNFGLAILAVTVSVKALFFPLANQSYKSMSAMKRVQPQMAGIREQYKDDKVKQQQALMELYKKEKINPLAGCWPIAIQIPVFFCLYKVLYVTIEMRHAPFFGWVQDLSAPDPTHIFNLFGLLPYDPTVIPIIGGFLAIGIWPVIMGITMFVQMRLNPTPPDPTQAALFTWMPLIFTFMLSTFPAGLVIYWAWNNTLSVTQQYFIMRRYGAEVNLWDNILTSLGLRKPKTATVPATASRPANDDRRPPKKAKAEKAKG